MKTFVASALIAWGTLAAAPDSHHSAWQWRQDIIIPAAGMVRLDLPPPTLNASRADLADLRLLSPAGVETPYLVEIPVPAAPKPPETVPLTVNLRPAAESPGITRIIIDLGAANLDLADLKLEVTDPVFSRHYTLGVYATNAAGLTAITLLTKGTLFRVLGDHGSTTEQLIIPLQQQIAAKQLLLTLINGDSPPLSLTGASARRFPTTLAFHAAQAGSWQLLTGNAEAASPSYDLAPLRGELTQAGGLRLSPGPLQAKADFQVPPALPGVDPAGAGIDLAEWGFRRAVNVPAGGVIHIELDPPALAHSSSDLSDLRLVQDGRQVPYLLEAETLPRTLKPVVVERPDPQRPGVSRWQLSLPLENLPITELLAESPARLFTRSFVATAERKDSLGNGWTQTLGTASWTQTAGSDNSPSGLRLGLSNTRLPAIFQLETANGDNPPIALENVRLQYRAPLIAAKLVSAAPLFLYYGNPQAAAPSYDLRLVRDALLAADKQPAELAAEETLRPERRRNAETSPGSPWLWAALALVVVVLLGVVARMLPQRV